jgi:hypothetical protein
LGFGVLGVWGLGFTRGIALVCGIEQGNKFTLFEYVDNLLPLLRRRVDTGWVVCTGLRFRVWGLGFGV